MSWICLLIVSAWPVSSLDKRMLTELIMIQHCFHLRLHVGIIQILASVSSIESGCQCPSKVFDTALAWLSHNSRITRNSAGADPNLLSQLAQSPEQRAREGESGSRGCFCPL